MPSIPAEPHRSVLIVDASDDARQILKMALHRRGLNTLEAASPADGLRLAQEHHPGVIVVDVEDGQDDSQQSGPQLAAHARGDSSSLVILGTTRRQAANYEGDEPTDSQFVRKPYHYGPLIRQIEQLLPAESPVKNAAA